MATLKRTMEQVMDREEGEDMSAGENCPLPTQDITLNLKNRAKAITSAGYGPENPKLPNEAFAYAVTARHSMCLTASKSALPKALAWKQTLGEQSSWLIWVTVKSLISSAQPVERAMHGWSVARTLASKRVKNLKSMKREKRNEARFVFQHCSKA